MHPHTRWSRALGPCGVVLQLRSLAAGIATFTPATMVSAQCADDVPPVVFEAHVGYGSNTFPENTAIWAGVPGASFEMGDSSRKVLANFGLGTATIDTSASGSVDGFGGFRATATSTILIYALFEGQQRVELDYVVQGHARAEWIDSDAPTPPCPNNVHAAGAGAEARAHRYDRFNTAQLTLPATTQVAANGHPRYRVINGTSYRRVDVDTDSAYAISSDARALSSRDGENCYEHQRRLTANGAASGHLVLKARVVSCNERSLEVQPQRQAGIDLPYASCRTEELLRNYESLGRGDGTQPFPPRAAMERWLSYYTIHNRGCDLAAFAMAFTLLGAAVTPIELDQALCDHGFYTEITGFNGFKSGGGGTFMLPTFNGADVTPASWEALAENRYGLWIDVASPPTASRPIWAARSSTRSGAGTSPCSA